MTAPCQRTIDPLAMNTIGIIFLAIGLVVVVAIAIIELRFLIRRWLSAKWPTTTAIIHAQSVDSIGKGGRAAFFTYQFDLQSNSYAGRFALATNEERGSKLLDDLDGLPIEVRYDPRRPNLSFLVNPYDSRFGGVAATQNPYWFFERSELTGSRVRLFKK